MLTEKTNKRFFITKILIIGLLLLSFLPGSRPFSGSLVPGIKEALADTATDEESDDYDLYQKYIKYQNSDKRSKYRKYKKYKKKYGFEDSKEKAYYKDLYDKYKLYKKDNKKYKQYARYFEQYKRYRDYKEKYQPYSKYSKYKKYDKAKYARPVYKNYGKTKYENGYNRYKAKLKAKVATEANLGGGSLGPEISVGLWSYSPSDLSNDPFKISANKNYVIKDSTGNGIAVIAAGTTTKVAMDASNNFKIYDSITERIVSKEVRFEAADGNNSNLIFDANKPSSSFDHYRGKITLRKSDSANDSWVINTLPMEHYVWGMGEITGTGPTEYNKVMTVTYRTYGYWKIKYSTKYAAQGFKVTATASSQVYYGYDWETTHQAIQSAAQATRGVIVMYGERIAITPYSSWTDGRTRSWEEHWGSENYPWCKSVADPYGKHPSMTTKQLQDAGNHMVGMSAHGALNLAETHKWDWQKILNYYYSTISLHTAY